MVALEPGAKVGNYQVEKLLGAGGMGAVYSALHVVLGTRVAIKTLLPDRSANPEARARLIREARAAVTVKHPNVVQVSDVGVHEDTPYLVMEWLDGESLGTLLNAAGFLSVGETVDLLLPVVLALDAAHRAGVLHRDLKPDNLFLMRGQHGDIVPKILDFGIAKLREGSLPSLTAENAVFGTIAYMSPEQANNTRSVDARSDIYSMGVILYECVVGTEPFRGTSIADLLRQVLLTPPPSIRERKPEVPVAFDAIVQRAMAKEPAVRQKDALELAHALVPFAHTPVRIVTSNSGSRLVDATTSPLEHSVSWAWTAWLIKAAALVMFVISVFFATTALMSGKDRQGAQRNDAVVRAPVAPPRPPSGPVIAKPPPAPQELNTPQSPQTEPNEERRAEPERPKTRITKSAHHGILQPQRPAAPTIAETPEAKPQTAQPGDV